MNGGYTAQEAVTKTIPKKKELEKANRLLLLQIAEERREAKSNGERERYIQLNAEFHSTARRDKVAFLNEQCKVVDENNKIGKTEISSRKLEI